MKYFIFILLMFPFAATAQKEWWQEFPAKPDNYVTDQQDILSSQEQKLLNTKLRAFEDSTTNQLFVYLAKSLNGKDLEDYSRKIFNKWGIGQKDKNNGILIAIFIEDRKYRIHIGYGLEGVLPSALTRQIQDDVMRSHFKEKNYYEGIDAGIDELIYYSKHEFQPPGPFDYLLIPAAIAYGVSLLFFIINLASLKKWKNQPRRVRKNILACSIFLLIPGLGTFVLMGLCLVINDKSDSAYDSETDDAYERRMRTERLRSDDNDSSSDSFSGGGGGSSGSGGSSSSW